MLQKQMMMLIFGSVVLSNACLANYTKPTLYQPFSHAPLKKDLYVYGTLKGSCHLQSNIDQRNDAWQCTSMGKIYDPCFKHPYGDPHELICPTSPWSKKSIKIITKNVLDNKEHLQLDMSQNPPWAMELTDGTHCLSEPSEGKTPHNYKCQHHQTLSGKLFRCKGTWKISRKDHDSIDFAEVKRAWF